MTQPPGVVSGEASELRLLTDSSLDFTSALCEGLGFMLEKEGLGAQF